MSFDVNVLSTKPVIKAAASMQNDGGGGNLGYMSQGRREEKQEKKYLDESIFTQKPEYDTFDFGEEKIDIPEEKFSLHTFVEKVILKLKNIFVK